MGEGDTMDLSARLHGAALRLLRALRRSPSLAVRLTRPCPTKASTTRLIVGGLTCSAAARAASESGPRPAIAASADSRWAERPLPSSARRNARISRSAAP